MGPLGHVGAAGRPDTTPPLPSPQPPAQACSGAPEPTVLAVDATGLLVRCSRAARPRGLHSSGGTPTGALMMFASALSRKVRAMRPGYLITAWDGPDALAWRRRYDPAYKATSASPAYLGAEMLQAQEFCHAAGIALAQAPWFEADDILAAVQRVFLRHMPEARLILCSEDTDVLQLAGERVLINAFSNDLLVTYTEIEKAWGVRPSRIPWVRALCGDRSDNIPGLRGIGRAKALRLVLACQGVWPPPESVLSSIPGMTGDQAEQVLAWKQIMDLNDPPRRPESIAGATIYGLLTDSRWVPGKDAELLEVFGKYELSDLRDRVREGRFW